MTVKDLMNQLQLTAVTAPNVNAEVEGVYIGDLLSWVMGRAQAGNAWITIMTNINVVAVASLVDTSCIILAEGVTLPQNVIDAAVAKEINILSTDKTAYDIAVAISTIV